MNRRIVVDEAFRRANRIADALKASLGENKATHLPQLSREMAAILRPTAEALMGLAGPGAPPLEAYPLRGATYTDNAWARSVVQPLVISSTLDQLGSRLLFRGYGCSSGARPTHAALLACDSLLLLDEAHSSAAFSKTIEDIERWRNHALEPLALPFRTIQLTATPPPGAAKPFTLLPEEKNEPTAARRIRVKKPVTLLTAGSLKSQFVKKLAETARGLSKTNRRLLIVVNRVNTAKQLHAELQKKPTSDILLLTGGIRPLHREKLINELVETYHLQQSSPPPDGRALILVATQCVEVGADFDFDALITELAPLDSLRQRFGRLNRYGRDIDAQAVIAASNEAIDPSKTDPIYGDGLPTVWQWLQKHETNLDFGIEALDTILPQGDELLPFLAPQSRGPILLPAHLDLLCQTWPSPHVEPEPALYIHGPQLDLPTVSVVIRNDLPAAVEQADALFRTLPPLATEAASISLPKAKSWLSETKDTDDYDSPHSIPGTKNKPEEARKEAWIVRGNQTLRIEDSRQLQPNDTLVLSPETPGLNELLPGGDTLDDHLEPAHLLATDKLLLHLTPGRMKRWIESRENNPPDAVLAALEALHDAQSACREDGEENPACEEEWKNLLEHIIPQPDGLFHPTVIGVLGKATINSLVFEPHPLGGIIARSKQRVGYTPWPLAPDFPGVQGNHGLDITLAAHQRQVENLVERSADKLGLPPKIKEALVCAARYHDLGKADPRFQAWLHGRGIHFQSNSKTIAKSSYPAWMSPRLRKLAQVPDGFRHEFLSALILAKSSEFQNRPERNLILHLIASHHGRCRAFATPFADNDPEDFDVVVNGETITYTGRSAPLTHIAEGVPRRFWELTRRFGWWGLPYLESIIRLADQEASAKPESI